MTERDQLSHPPTAPEKAVAPNATTTSGLAIAALVLGIVWVYWIGSILAIIFGGVALRQIKQSSGRRTGKGMAIAGLVLGLTGVGTLLLLIIAAAVAGDPTARAVVERQAP